MSVGFGNRRYVRVHVLYNPSWEQVILVSEILLFGLQVYYTMGC